jgi:hypothetical protein
MTLPGACSWQFPAASVPQRNPINWLHIPDTLGGGVPMRDALLALWLLFGSFLLAQTNNNQPAEGQTPADSNGQVTLQGCVDRSRGDYVLIQTNPGMTYELRSTGKIKLRHYMGQQVEVTGTKSASMSTSSDAIAFGGSPSPVTVSVKSITTLAAQCTVPPVGK